MRFPGGNARLRALVLVAAGVAAAGFAPAPPSLDALSKLERGRWQVRDLDADADREALCLGDPMSLLQIEHGAAACEAEVIENGPDGGTVRYTCRGHGYGQSTIRISTPRFARIDTQGIKDRNPFSYRAEARKIGDC